MTPFFSRKPVLDDRGLPPQYQLRPEVEVTPRQVRDWCRQADADLVLIDCRTPAEHELVHIDDAVLVPLQQAAARVADLQPYADKKIVVYCHHGMRSMQMTMLLRRAGFPNAFSMAGGIDLW